MHIFIFIWNFKNWVWKLLLYVILSPERQGRLPTPPQHTCTKPLFLPSSPFFLFGLKGHNVRFEKSSHFFQLYTAVTISLWNGWTKLLICNVSFCKPQIWRKNLAKKGQNLRKINCEWSPEALCIQKSLSWPGFWRWTGFCVSDVICRYLFFIHMLAWLDLDRIYVH